MKRKRSRAPWSGQVRAHGDVHKSRHAEGQRAVWYPWSYIEGLTIAEATNELAFMVTGITASRCRRRTVRRFAWRRQEVVSSRWVDRQV
jgi:hypothetical protein